MELELRPVYSAADRLTVAEILGIIVEQHLAGKAFQRPAKSYMNAWIRTSGRIFFDAFNEPDVLRHLNIRASEGASPQTRKHDMKLVTMAFNVSRRYKRNRWVVAGFDFAGARLPDEDPTKYVKRPKCQPRKRPVREYDFSRWIEHSHP